MRLKHNLTRCYCSEGTYIDSMRDVFDLCTLRFIVISISSADMFVSLQIEECINHPKTKKYYVIHRSYNLKCDLYICIFKQLKNIWAGDSAIVVKYFYVTWFLCFRATFATIFNVKMVFNTSVETARHNG